MFLPIRRPAFPPFLLSSPIADLAQSTTSFHSPSHSQPNQPLTDLPSTWKKQESVVPLTSFILGPVTGQVFLFFGPKPATTPAAPASAAPLLSAINGDSRRPAALLQPVAEQTRQEPTTGATDLLHRRPAQPHAGPKQESSPFGLHLSRSHTAEQPHLDWPANGQGWSPSASLSGSTDRPSSDRTTSLSRLHSTLRLFLTLLAFFADPAPEEERTEMNKKKPRRKGDSLLLCFVLFAGDSGYQYRCREEKGD